MKNLPITQKLGQSFKNFFFCEPCFGNGVGWAGLGWAGAGAGWAGRLGWSVGFRVGRTQHCRYSNV